MFSQKPTIADYLTMSRLLMAPVAFYLILQRDFTQIFIGGVLFGVAAITDVIDGYVARRTRISELGKFLDPVADKLLTGLFLCALAYLTHISWFFVIIIILRDVIVTSTRLWKISADKKVITPLLTAKLKTSLEMVLIGALLFWVAFARRPLPDELFYVSNSLAAIVSILAWITGTHYIRTAFSKKK